MPKKKRKVQWKQRVTEVAQLLDIVEQGTVLDMEE